MKKACLILLFLFPVITKAQQTSAVLPCTHLGQMSQSFYWQGGMLNEIEVPVFSRYGTQDHPAVLRILDNNFGVVFQNSIFVPNLEKIFGFNIFGLSISQIENLWDDLQIQIDSGLIGFYDLKEKFVVNQNFPAGQYFFSFELDTSVSNQGYKSITVFSNCFDPGPCDPKNPNPYTLGEMLWGFGMIPIFLDADMAFAITSPTGIFEFETEIGVKKHSSEIFDLSGRKVTKTNLSPGIYISGGKKIIILGNTR